MSHSALRIHVEQWEDAASINAELEVGLRLLMDDPDIPRSHWFAGRHENIYVPEDRLPALGALVAAARVRAARIIGHPAAALRCRYWLNAMGPGEHTGLHSHDEDDEILSGVYYVRVPRGSGDLIVGRGEGSRRIVPREGSFVFFPPGMPHEVEANRASQMRLSIGMNFGSGG